MNVDDALCCVSRKVTHSASTVEQLFASACWVYGCLSVQMKENEQPTLEAVQGIQTTLTALHKVLSPAVERTVCFNVNPLLA